VIPSFFLADLHREKYDVFLEALSYQYVWYMAFLEEKILANVEAAMENLLLAPYRY